MERLISLFDYGELIICRQLLIEQSFQYFLSNYHETERKLRLFNSIRMSSKITQAIDTIEDAYQLILSAIRQYKLRISTKDRTDITRRMHRMKAQFKRTQFLYGENIRSI